MIIYMGSMVALFGNFFLQVGETQHIFISPSTHEELFSAVSIYMHFSISFSSPRIVSMFSLSFFS